MNLKPDLITGEFSTSNNYSNTKIWYDKTQQIMANTYITKITSLGQVNLVNL